MMASTSGAIINLRPQDLSRVYETIPAIDDGTLDPRGREVRRSHHRYQGAPWQRHGRAHSPFWDLPDVVITPHTSALTDRYMSDSLDFYEENIPRFAEGEPLMGVVDKEAGY